MHQHILFFLSYFVLYPHLIYRHWIILYINTALTRPTVSLQQVTALLGGTDPELPNSVRQGIDILANDVCVDVNIKILEALRENVGGQKDSVKFIKQNNPKCCRPNCCNYLRSSILYTLYPYDRSLWSRLRDPWYFLFKLFTIFPLYYVSISTWFILWLMKDKRDEYTLVKFIVDLKSSLFVSAVLSSILGNIMFLRCTTIDPTTLPCHSNSPGQLQPFWPVVSIQSDTAM